MNAPLPEPIRQAIERVTLDDIPRSGLRRSHKHSMDGEAEHTGFGVKRLRQSGAPT